MGQNTSVVYNVLQQCVDNTTQVHIQVCLLMSLLVLYVSVFVVVYTLGSPVKPHPLLDRERTTKQQSKYMHTRTHARTHTLQFSLSWMDVGRDLGPVMRKVVLTKTGPPDHFWQPKVVHPGPILAAKSGPTLPKVVWGRTDHFWLPKSAPLTTFGCQYLSQHHFWLPKSVPGQWRI